VTGIGRIALEQDVATQPMQEGVRVVLAALLSRGQTALAKA
jgi:hypothetical protein